MGCLIVFRSVTYAQNAQSLLNRNGISGVLARPPLGLGKGSCSYALKVKDADIARAAAAVRASPVPMLGAYRFSGGQYQEV